MNQNTMSQSWINSSWLPTLTNASVDGNNSDSLHGAGDNGVSLVEMVFLSSLNIFSTLIGVLGNLAVCLVVVKFRFLGRQRVELFVCSLACSDLLVCVLAQPLYVVHLTKTLPATMNAIRSALTWIGTLASVSSLLAISIDRFLALYYLHQYRAWITPLAAGIAVVTPWLLSVALGISTSFTREARFVSQYYVITVLLVVAVVYIGIFFIVRAQGLKVRRRTYAVVPRKQPLRVFAREKKIAKLIAMVIGVFYACYAPLIILPFFTNFSHIKAVAWRGFPWANTLALCNSCVNPYIYYWGNWRFRSAVKRVTSTSRVFNKLKMGLRGR